MNKKKLHVNIKSTIAIITYVKKAERVDKEI